MAPWQRMTGIAVVSDGARGHKVVDSWNERALQGEAAYRTFRDRICPESDNSGEISNEWPK